MSLITLSPAYVPLLQKPHFCAAACIQMIMYRNGFGLHDQEEIAIALGVSVSSENSSAFSSRVNIGSAGSLGMSTINSSKKINEVFQKFGASLIASPFRSSEIVNFSDFISGCLAENRDVWVEYHAHGIHGDDKMYGRYMHDGLIEFTDSSSGMACLIDPMPNHRQRIMVDLLTLGNALSAQLGAEGGAVVVSRR